MTSISPQASANLITWFVQHVLVKSLGKIQGVPSVGIVFSMKSGADIKMEKSMPIINFINPFCLVMIIVGGMEAKGFQMHAI